jgi:hypothetical protein
VRTRPARGGMRTPSMRRRRASSHTDRALLHARSELNSGPSGRHDKALHVCLSIGTVARALVHLSFAHQLREAAVAHPTKPAASSTRSPTLSPHRCCRCGRLPSSPLSLQLAKCDARTATPTETCWDDEVARAVEHRKLPPLDDDRSTRNPSHQSRPSRGDCWLPPGDLPSCAVLQSRNELLRDRRGRRLDVDRDAIGVRRVSQGPQAHRSCCGRLMSSGMSPTTPKPESEAPMTSEPGREDPRRFRRAAARRCRASSPSGGSCTGCPRHAGPSG